MSECGPPVSGATESGLEDRIRRFERDWVAGRVPLLDEYISDHAAIELLVELAHIDLEFRIKLGEPVRAAGYLSRYPQLAADGAVAAELILAEYELRRRDDPSLVFEAVAAEYPQYQAELLALPSRTDTWLDDGPSGTQPLVSRILPTAPGYQILGRLGAGGMGVVYRARDEQLDRVVALKFLPTEYARDPERLALFHREARTASALNHPHICTIHDLGEHDDRPFIVMEFVEGRTLRDLIRDRPGIGECARLIGQAARALAVAHAAGVVHRDIKPDNLMVRADGYLKVLDFGLARRLPGSHTGTWSVDPQSDYGGVIGTLPYMSPEQAQNQPIGPPSDVFSLGVVLYEIATAAHPFSESNPLDTLNAIVEDTPITPSMLNPEIPGELDSLLERMLSKEPGDRPSAADVESILSALSGAPALAAISRPVQPPRDPSPRKDRCTVGRLAELNGLRAAFESAAAGAGEMVCVVGEPGIGKTTVVEEFLEALPTEGQAFHLVRGQCSERLSEAEAYLPILEALDSLIRGAKGDVAGRHLRTLAPTWFSELGPARTQPEVENLAASQTRLKRELAAFLAELSRSAPAVLFIDDFHWADVPTADLISYLGRHCPGHRLLIIVAYRRDELLLANHPFIPVKRDLQGRGVCREIPLRLLGRDDVDRYLGLVFPGHDFPADLGATIHARTGGNALFIAEMVRFLCDRNVLTRQGSRWILARPLEGSELPESIRGLTRRKLNQLPPEDRRLLTSAAVAGAEFDSAALARALGNDPAEVEERLQALENVHGLVRLIREQELPNRTVSRRYRFVHILFHEALAEGLTPARRAAISRSLADSLLAMHNGHPGLAAADLALLYESGREFGKAAELLHKAAENAARVFAHREAAGLARRGLNLLRDLPDTPDRAALEFRLQMMLGLQLQITDGFAAPAVENAYLRAREVWERSPEVGPLFPILWGLWLFYKVRSELGRAHLLAADLLSLAEQSRDPAHALQARQAGAIVALCAGDPTATRLHTAAAARLYDPARHRSLTVQFGQDPGIACLAFGAVASWLVGEPAEALDQSRLAVRLARDSSQPSTLALALHFAAVLHQLRNDAPAVRDCAGEVLAVAVEHRFAFWHGGATVMLGWASAVTGSEDGPALLRQGIDAWRATGSETYWAYSLTLLADGCLKLGRTDEAMAVLDETERVIEQTGERLLEGEAHRLRGNLLALRSVADAEKAYRRALGTARTQKARSLALRAAVGLAEVLKKSGRQAEAQAVVAEWVKKPGKLEAAPEMALARAILAE